MRRLILLLLLSIPHALLAADAPDRDAIKQHLASDVAAVITAGSKPKAWIHVFSKSDEVVLSASDAKSLTVMIEGNAMPMAWNKLSDEDVLSVAKGIATGNGERLLFAAQTAIALNFPDQARNLLIKVRDADPNLADKIAALAAKIPDSAPPIPVATNTSTQSPEKAPEVHSAITTRLPVGWWKGLQIPAVPLSKVYAGRPRIFLRDKAWGDGLTLDVLRTRGTQDPWKGWIPRFTNDVSSEAMHYLLTGDKAAADEAVKVLLSKFNYQQDTDDGDDLEQWCMAYDWLHLYPDFTADQKKTAAESIATVATELMKRLQTGGPHIFHTRMQAWANGVVFAGITLAGDHPKAEEFVNFGYKYWREKLFPAHWHLDGAWANGFGYGRKFFCRSTFSFLNAWKSATGEDLWALIQREQNDWARAKLYYLLYTQKPDGSYPRYGDCFNSDDEKFSGGLAMMAACGTHDPYACGLVDALHKKHGLRTVEDHWNIYPFLFWDPTLPKKSPDDLPASRAFGPQALGCVVMRGGWGAKDAYVFYKCGDYIENHGHFDQGSFDIFRERPLAIYSGSYSSGMGTPPWVNYYHQTVATNSLLIANPADAKDNGCQRIVNFQNADTMDTYLAHTECEMGNIVDFRTDPDCSVVISDLTAAYDKSKVTSVTRSLVFLKGTYLIVCDSVQTAKPGLSVRFMLHYPTDATIDKSRTVIDNAPTRLTCDTLLPENAKITKLPGWTVNGTDYPPGGNKAEAGAGRVEIESTEANAILLNILTIAPKDFSPERAKAKSDGNEVRVEIAGRVITFRGNTVSVR